MFAYLCTMFFQSSYEIKLKAETITNIRTIFFNAKRKRRVRLSIKSSK